MQRAHVETVERIVARLAPELHTSVKVSPRLAKLLAFVDQNGATGDVALHALAESLHASIVARGKGFVLERTPEDSQAFERARLAERAGWIQSRLDDVAKYRAARLKGRPLESVVSEEVEKASKVYDDVARGKRQSPEGFFATELLPSENLLRALIQSIGTKAFASVPVGQSSVWEDAPVVGAAPLPSYAEALDEYAVAVESVREATISDSLKGKMAGLGMTPFFADWGRDAPLPKRLRLQVRAEESMIQLSLTGYDTQGRQQIVATMIAQPRKVWRPPSIIVQDALQRSNARWRLLSASAAVFASDRGRDALAREKPAWFVDPEKNEPLDLFVAESFSALASESPGKCLAAQVSDGVWDDARHSIVGGRVNLEAFEAMLKQWTFYERIESKGRVVWRPREGIDATECLANRGAMGRFARSVVGRKALDLRTLAAYHAALGEQPTALASYWESALRMSRDVRTFSGDASHAFYRLLGTLNGGLWTRLESGETPTVADLGIRGPFGALLDEDRMPVRRDGPYPDVFRHPRELFPDGSIQRSTLAISYRSQELLGVSSPQGDGIMQWSTGIPNISILRVVSKPDGGKELSMTRKEYEAWLGERRFQIGIQKERTVRIGLPGGAFLSATFTDPLVPVTEVVKYDLLPAASRDAIWEKAVEAANRMESGRSTTSVGASP